MAKILSSPTDPGTASWVDGEVPPAGSAVGDLLTWNGSAWVPLASGTDGQSLVANGAGVAPTYQTSPENLVQIWQAGEDLAAGDPCYISGYNGGTGNPILSIASTYPATSALNSIWKRNLWFADEAITSGETGRFVPWRYNTLDTSTSAQGAPIYLSDNYLSGTLSLTPFNTYAEAARVVGEVLTVGNPGVIRVWGNFAGPGSYLTKVFDLKGALMIRMGAIAGSFTSPVPLQFIDAHYQAGNTGGPWTWTLKRDALTIATETVSPGAVGDISRITNMATVSGGVGGVWTSTLTGAGSPSGTAYLTLLPISAG